MVKLKMIDNFLLGITPHLFIVMFILIENPFKIGHALSKLDLLPYLSLIHDGSNQVLVIVAVYYCKG